MSSPPAKFRIAIIGSGPIGKLVSSSVQLHPRIELLRYEGEPVPRPGFGYGVGPQALRAYSVASAAVGKRVYDACLLGPLWMTWWHSGTEDRLIEDVHMPDGQIHGWIGRDELLDALDACTPDGLSPIQYGKSLRALNKQGDGLLELEFQDGTKEIVNAVWACEGINSLCRKVLQGGDFKPPVYSGMLCFRGKVPSDLVRTTLDDQFAKGQYMFIGTKGWHILTFPIAGGKFINIACFCVEPEWKRLGRDYKPTKEDILKYFPERNKTADAMIQMLVDEGCQRLELTHLGELGAFTNPELLITTFGDAANAMCPHMAGSMSTGVIGVATFVQEWNKRVQSLNPDASDVEIAKVFADASQAYESRQKPLAQTIVNDSLRQGEFGWSSGSTDHDYLKGTFPFLWNAASNLEQ
ncbi:hypothetical protein BX600DRAFT_514464 [Xylariales sp. PMI_506]|nr:hypothetical protein BX600DRAFT_514464 [Xylariales sp. PMI_506]